MRTPGLAAVVGCAAAGAVLAVARRTLVMVTVQGWSMAPTLDDGDRLLVQRVRGTAVRSGQIVVVEHPDSRDGSYRAAPAADRADGRVWMIKRCTAVAGDPVPAGLPARCATEDGCVPPGTFTVLSDNPSHPNDSRTFGFIACDRVLGVVARPPRRSVQSRLRLVPDTSDPAPGPPRTAQGDLDVSDRHA